MIALFGGGWIGSLIGGVGGAIVGGLGLCFVVMLMVALSSNHSARKAPAVSIDPVPPPAVGQDASILIDAAARLRRLDQLKSEGLVTEAEYADQRRTIIGAI